MNAKLSKTTLIVNGKRAGVWIDGGPWVEGVNPDLIKIRSKRHAFPAEIREAFEVENNSDMREDYFEADVIRLLPGHPLYETASALASR